MEQVPRPRVVLTLRDDTNIDVQTSGVDSPLLLHVMLAQVLSWSLSAEKADQPYVRIELGKEAK